MESHGEQNTIAQTPKKGSEKGPRSQKTHKDWTDFHVSLVSHMLFLKAAGNSLKVGNQYF